MASANRRAEADDGLAILWVAPRGWVPSQGMSNATQTLERTADHVLDLHRRDVISEACAWLRSPEGRDATGGTRVTLGSVAVALERWAARG